MTLAERLALGLEPRADPPVLLAGDLHDPVTTHAGSLIQAAVLIAVTDRAEPGVILTRRTDTMRAHAGQIAFPGGRLDPGEDAVSAALREADEEVALPRSAVTVVGTIERYRTATGYNVTPVLAVVSPDLLLVPHNVEVADVFEVPLQFLLDPANRVEASAQWQGRERRFFEIEWQGRRIWGATAAMIVNLSRRLAWPV